VQLIPQPDRQLPARDALRWVAAGRVGKAGGVVDQQLQAALLGLDPLEQPLDGSVVAMIQRHRDPLATQTGDLLGGLGDGAGPAAAAGVQAATGDIHRRALLAQGQRDALADAAAGPGHHRHHAGQGWGHLSHDPRHLRHRSEWAPGRQRRAACGEPPPDYQPVKSPQRPTTRKASAPC
jgi:hypothetical protein